MSDTNIAPSAPAPSAPAPAPANEAVINPTPVSAPQPIGSQAPSAPPAPEVKGPAEHRRDIIRKAFQRASEPEAAKPKMGHNQPPEPMEKERPKAAAKETAPLDLKKKPSEQPVARERGEGGRFAAKPPASTAPGQPQADVEQPPHQPATPLPEHAPYRNPPKRWDAQAKADWHAAPESVRASVHRTHKEFSAAYQRMRGDHEEMNSLRPYQQMAVQQGTTIKRALDNYVPMEAKLRSDPIGGLDVIVNNLNLRTSDGQRLTLRDIAWHIVNQTPDQHRMLATQNTQSAMSQQMGQLHRQQQAIAQGLKQLHYERRFSHTRSEVDRFAETHPRLDELGSIIEKELRLGFDLPTAYKRAELLKPANSAAHAAQTRTATAQTRSNSDRSIHGAPDGANGSRPHQGKSVGRRDAIANAVKRVSGAL